MTEKAATQLKEIYNKGRKAKSLIPQGLIPDLEHRPTRKKPATTTNRKTTRGHCNPNYTYPGGGTPKQ